MGRGLRWARVEATRALPEDLPAAGEEDNGTKDGVSRRADSAHFRPGPTGDLAVGEGRVSDWRGMDGEE